MVNLVHVITGLNTGGAEMVLYKNVAFANRARFNISVVSMLPEGPVAEKIKAAGVPVISLGMKRSLPSPGAVITLASYLRRERADIVQTWMYHANLLGGLSAKAAGVPCVWGIHHSNLSPEVNRLRTRVVAKACAALSGVLPDRIVCCALRAFDLHAGIGYRRERMLVIPNGFDVRDFRPRAEARAVFRAELGLPEDAFLIGMVGRYDPQKDHANFLRAAQLFTETNRDAQFVLCGDGLVRDNEDLVRLMSPLAKRRTHLLGRRSDIPMINAALDLATLSSSDGEAFPNVVGEAMACGVPCVVTDVGDSAFIVGDTGLTVPPRDSRALADAWAEIYDMGEDARIILGKRARARICGSFEITDIVRRYEELYEDVLDKRFTGGGTG